MEVSSSQDEGGTSGVWLRVRMLKSLVLSLRTTVRGMRVSFSEAAREAVQTFSARRTIMGLFSEQGLKYRGTPAYVV